MTRNLSQWYTGLPPLDPTLTTQPTTHNEVAALTSKAADLHEKEVKAFTASSNTSSSEASFFSKVIQSGTLSDRLSALTLLVQSSPLHNAKALETLKGLAERGKGKGGREESLKAMRCIVDWWVGGGAPSRKLKYFRDQPLSHPSVTDQHLVTWYFEDWLKKYFFSVLQILENLSLDPLPYVRTQALTLIATLLRDKPEQEHNLLRLLVNKLGDPEKSLCSRASYHILQILQAHPQMKPVVIREITALVLRPSVSNSTITPTAASKHIRFDDATNRPKPKSKETEKKGENSHARYYAAITFNQIVLSPGDKDAALQLIDVYFEIFKEILGEDSSPNEAGDAEDPKSKEFVVDKKGRVHDEKKRKGKGKGKEMEQKGAAGFTEVEDANSRLISAILSGVNRALPFSKIHSVDSRINKHLDTLFHITHTSTFNTSLQALVLIQQVSSSLDSAPRSESSSSTSTAKSVKDRYYRALYASLLDNRLSTSSKQAMYLNLLFKSIKQDVAEHGNERIKAMIRRFVQILVSSSSGTTEFIAGGLYLLGELFSSIPGLRSMVNSPPSHDATEYDPKKRDPQFAFASSSPLWELTPLLNHYHPAIALHARQLLTSQPLTASADLSQNTLSHFLDRFVYKNPKKTKAGEPKGKGASAMQPAATGLEGVKIIKGEVEGQGRVNDPDFLKKHPQDVPADQFFFYKYFTTKKERDQAKVSKLGKRKAEEDGTESEADGDEDKETGTAQQASDISENEEKDSDSDLDESEIWKAMQATMPKADDDALLLESDSDGDSLDADLDLDDEDSEDQGSEDNDEEEEDAISLAEGSDNDDLVSLNGDIPDGLLIPYDGSEDGSDADEWGGIAGEEKKRKREGESSAQRRKKLKSLPTFASYEDYAKLIDAGPEDDI